MVGFRSWTSEQRWWPK